MITIIVCYRRQGCPNGKRFYRELEVEESDVYGWIYSEIDEDYTILGWTRV